MQRTQKAAPLILALNEATQTVDLVKSLVLPNHLSG
jgi:hypothetical protein